MAKKPRLKLEFFKLFLFPVLWILERVEWSSDGSCKTKYRLNLRPYRKPKPEIWND